MSTVSVMSKKSALVIFDVQLNVVKDAYNRDQVGVNPFYRTQEEVNFRFNQARMSVPRRFQKSSQVARSSQCA